jgi:DNA-binding HxlR family transcriptional regulator
VKPTGGGRQKEFAREVACMIRVDDKEYCIDPAHGVVDVLGKKWTLALIGVLGNRQNSRFSELRDAVHGMGSKALAERLKELQNLGLIAREAFAEVPVRTEYRLTESGTSLRRALVPLLGWAAVDQKKGLRAKANLPTPGASRTRPARP